MVESTVMVAMEHTRKSMSRLQDGRVRPMAFFRLRRERNFFVGVYLGRLLRFIPNAVCEAALGFSTISNWRQYLNGFIIVSGDRMVMPYLIRLYFSVGKFDDTVRKVKVSIIVSND
jgi:hypothetical protein